ncbi:MAG: hypothetical protein FWF90_10585 [Promicromonosporaceae bacterium]|nr:hypothetical protein [Promicromonosporaceae bacterium]
MKRLMAGAASAALALTAFGVAAAAPASAATPYVYGSCSSLSVYLSDVAVDSTIDVVIDGTSVESTTASDTSYSNAFDLDWATPHDWSVDVDDPASDDADVHQSGTTTPCDSDPNVWATAWSSCQELDLQLSGYPDGSRATTVVDGTTVDDQAVSSWYSFSQPLDWTVSHTYAVTVDAPDDTLDRSWDGTTTPCDTDPNLQVNVSAWCGYVGVSVYGYPDGTQVSTTVDDTVLDTQTIAEGSGYWYSTDVDPDASHTWAVTLTDPSGAQLRQETGTLDCAPWQSPTVSVNASCSSLDVWVDVSAFPSGSTAEVSIDGSVTATAPLGDYFYASYELGWQSAHDWTVRVLSPDGAEASSRSGTSTPCDTDPNPPLQDYSTCSAVTAQANDAMFTDGSLFEVSVDGKTEYSEAFTTAAYATIPVDYLVAHDYVLTATAPDGTTLQQSGTTTPCTQGEHAVHVDAQCGLISAWVDDPWIGTAGTVDLEVDGKPAATAPMGRAGNANAQVAVDQQVAHTWTFTLDATDDARDWTESGQTTPCPVDGVIVQPTVPDPVTGCDATPADLVAPASTEAITYTLEKDGLHARTNPGYVFAASTTALTSYRTVDGSELVLATGSLLTPECDLPVTTLQAVCDAGTAYLDYAVTPPADASENYFVIEWEGPRSGYDVVYGDAGFGHPFTGRVPLPAFVKNDDGTVSPAYDPTWRLASIHLRLAAEAYVGYPGDDGWYARSYVATIDNPPMTDPCVSAGDGPGTTTLPRGLALGRDHVGHPAHPVPPARPVTPGRPEGGKAA